MESRMHNLHVPLPHHLYEGLKLAAKQASLPLTELARNAIAAFVAEQERQRLYREIREYALAVGGSPDDLDTDLEAAGIQHWLEVDPQ